MKIGLGPLSELSLLVGDMSDNTCEGGSSAEAKQVYLPWPTGHRSGHYERC